MRKSILKLLIGSLCFSALIWIIIILSGNFGKVEGKILSTTATIFAFSISGLCCSTLYEKEKYKLFSTFGMIICLLACIWSILIIWGFLNSCIIFCSGNSSYFTWRMLWTLIVLSYSSAHISLLLLIKNENDIVIWAKNLTILLSVILDIMILTIAWDIISGLGFYGRLIWVCTILVTLGTIISPILNKVYMSTDNFKMNNSDSNVQ